MGEDSVDITYGEPFNVAQEIPQTFAATDKEAEWSAVVQKKTERYIPLFKKFENGDMFSWNWAALFGVIWLLYRKAYIAALLIFLLGNLLSCLGVWGLALPIATALLGDFIYYKHVERVVENAKFVPDKKRITPKKAVPA